MTWLLHCHHFDHNSGNNQLSNLKMLCGNCHQLEHTKNHSSITPSLLPSTHAPINPKQARCKDLQANKNYKPDHPFTLEAKSVIDSRKPGENLIDLVKRFSGSYNTLKRIVIDRWPELWVPNNDTYLKSLENKAKKANKKTK
jgi:hypothetical protein